MKHFFTILLLIITTALCAQDAADALKEGNHFYSKSEWSAAEVKYNGALSGKYKSIALFNRGNSLFKQNKYSSALKDYTSIATKNDYAEELRADAYYNIGVLKSNQKLWNEAIDAYRNTLRLHPSDNKARENLQKAMLEKKKEERKNSQKDNPNIPKPTNHDIQQLNKLEQKEKKTQQKIMQGKSQYTGNQGKDW